MTWNPKKTAALAAIPALLAVGQTGAHASTTTSTSKPQASTGTQTQNPFQSIQTGKAPLQLPGSGSTTTPLNSAGHVSTANHSTQATTPVKTVVKPTTPTVSSPPGNMYDSAQASNLSGIPAPVATYANGPYAANPATVAGHKVIWIDTNASDPRANALDIEPGDASPSQAAGWVQAHEQDSSTAPVLYSSVSTWGAVLQSVHTLPQWEQAKVKYWIADPNGTPHGIPGASAVQFLWNGNAFDESTYVGGFLNGIPVQK